MRSRLLTIGTFDLFHAGHAAFLRQCERFAGEVVVGVNSDAFVTGYKGQAPIFDERERVGFIRALGYPVKINDGPGRTLIEDVEPDVIAIGTDWARRDYFAQIDTPVEYFERLGIVLVYIPYTQGISSTIIKERLA